jgi:hypothetical protein
MGKCHVELDITVNTGNYSSVKAHVGFEESYEDSPRGSSFSKEARDAKFAELLAVCDEKLDDAVLAAIRKINSINKKD